MLIKVAPKLSVEYVAKIFGKYLSLHIFNKLTCKEPALILTLILTYINSFKSVSY